MEEAKNIDEVLQAVSYGKRRQIIELLAEKGPLGITELKKELNMSTGSLYHNLSFLQNYIERDGKKYKLNGEGMKLYRMIKEGNIDIKESRVNILDSLLPMDLTYLVFSNKVFSVASSISILSLLFLFAHYFKMRVIVLLLEGPWIEEYARLTSIAVSLVVLLVVSYLLSFIFRVKKKEEKLSILENFPPYLLSYIPQILYYFIAFYFNLLHTLPMEVFRLIAILLSIVILGAAIRTTTSLRSGESLVIAFFIAYFSSILETLVGRLVI